MNSMEENLEKDCLEKGHAEKLRFGAKNNFLVKKREILDKATRQFGLIARCITEGKKPDPLGDFIASKTALEVKYMAQGCTEDETKEIIREVRKEKVKEEVLMNSLSEKLYGWLLLWLEDAGYEAVRAEKGFSDVSKEKCPSKLWKLIERTHTKNQTLVI